MGEISYIIIAVPAFFLLGWYLGSRDAMSRAKGACDMMGGATRALQRRVTDLERELEKAR